MCLLDAGLKSLRQSGAAENIFPGDRVLVAGKRTGTVHFVGSTEFAPGVHCRVCVKYLILTIVTMLPSVL